MRDKNESIDVARLADIGVISTIQTQLIRNDVYRFIFVSQDPTPVLDDLSNRSHTCNNDAKTFLDFSTNSSREHRQEFQALCQHWNLDVMDLKQVRQSMLLLQNLNFESGFKKPSELLALERRARSFAIGEGSVIVEVLIGFLSSELGNEIVANDLRACLRDKGLPPRDRLDDPSVAKAIETLREQFFRRMVYPHDHIVARDETKELVSLIQAIDGPQLIFLHGSAGQGKSGVLQALGRHLEDSQIPFLPIQLDVHRPENNESAYFDTLGLPDHPARCLLSIANNKPAVLIIDQLDAVRWTAAHSDAAWQICRDIVELALGRSSIRVVLACRTFDLTDDQRFKAWENELSDRSSGVGKKVAKRLEVKPLADEYFKGFFELHADLQ